MANFEAVKIKMYQYSFFTYAFVQPMSNYLYRTYRLSFYNFTRK